MTKELPSFQAYQQQFTAYIRNPRLNKPPKGAAIKGMRVYAEIVMNNIEASVAACFPVCKQVLGKRAWLALVRQFFSTHASNTPIFREIPEQFLNFLNTLPSLPPYLTALAHYEWVELSVAMSQASPKQVVDIHAHFLLDYPVLNPTALCLRYHYPVHMISPKFKPSQALDSPVHLLVFRNLEHEVKFVEINAMTAALFETLALNQYTGQAALIALAHQMGYADHTPILNFGAQLLEDLQAQGAILGASKQL
jgi:uncharacterized protein